MKVFGKTLNILENVLLEIRLYLQEHDQKAALSSEIRKNRNKPRISKTQLRVGFESTSYRNQENLSLTHYPLSYASLKSDKH